MKSTAALVIGLLLFIVAMMVYAVIVTTFFER
jgi:hypothetical protein